DDLVTGVQTCALPISYTTRDGLPNNRIISLAVNREGGIWIGTASGLSRFADKHFSSFRPGDGLATEIILSIFEDREGSLWIGTRSEERRVGKGCRSRR